MTAKQYVDHCKRCRSIIRILLCMTVFVSLCVPLFFTLTSISSLTEPIISISKISLLVYVVINILLVTYYFYSVSNTKLYFYREVIDGKNGFVGIKYPYTNDESKQIPPIEVGFYERKAEKFNQEILHYKSLSRSTLD